MTQQVQPSRRARVFGYAITIAITVVIWVVLHLARRLGPPFIDFARFPMVLAALDLSLGATILLNAIYILVDSRLLRAVGQVILNVLSINVLRQFYRIYPFDLPGALDRLVRPLFLALILALVVATFVQVAQALTNTGN